MKLQRKIAKMKLPIGQESSQSGLAQQIRQEVADIVTSVAEVETDPQQLKTDEDGGSWVWSAIVAGQQLSLASTSSCSAVGSGQQMWLTSSCGWLTLFSIKWLVDTLLFTDCWITFNSCIGWLTLRLSILLDHCCLFVLAVHNDKNALSY